jgi:hypothetical protein
MLTHSTIQKKGLDIMAINAKETRIAEIEHLLFVMEFKDHWTKEDWAERARLNQELNELRGN